MEKKLFPVTETPDLLRTIANCTVSSKNAVTQWQSRRRMLRPSITEAQVLALTLVTTVYAHLGHLTSLLLSFSLACRRLQD